MGEVIMARRVFAGRCCSVKGINLIRAFCPVDMKARQNDFGDWVVGYNHRAGVSCLSECEPGTAAALLAYDIGVIAAAICERIEVPLEQHQFDVLCSFLHDFGIEALHWWPGVEMLNRGNYTDIPAELNRWTAAGAVGRVAQRRSMRRQAECQTWMGIGCYA